MLLDRVQYERNETMFPGCRCNLFISSLEGLVCISFQLKGQGYVEIMLLVETSCVDDKQNLFSLYFISRMVATVPVLYVDARLATGVIEYKSPWNAWKWGRQIQSPLNLKNR